MSDVIVSSIGNWNNSHLCVDKASDKDENCPNVYDGVAAPENSIATVPINRNKITKRTPLSGRTTSALDRIKKLNVNAEPNKTTVRPNNTCPG